MEKFISYKKLSKKEKRKMDLTKRQTWGELNPVTRKPQNSKADNRKRTQEWKKELPDLRPFFISLLHQAVSLGVAIHDEAMCIINRYSS